jgi:Pyridoxamine 5'-phosphate oxidase
MGMPAAVVRVRPCADAGERAFLAAGRRAPGGGAQLLAVHHHAGGAPHAAPVWGMVTGHILYLYSERRAVKARNLAADPRVVVHLESGEDVVIVGGTAEDLGTPADAPEVVAALSAEYVGEGDRQYLPDADPDFDVVYAVRPESAMMWRLADYEASQYRWTS